ncbi:MAG: exodeoxyribonuclease V subunit gamma, partial [Actinomycetes bacterium]
MLYLHRSERADALLGALAQVLVRPLADPMAAEILCVPSRGVERWISQGLAVRLGATRSGAGDGISANIDFPFPAGVFGDVVAKATGLDPRLDPWNNGEAFWALVARIDANMDSGWMGLVSSQIRAARDHGCANRVGTARYIWDLFCRYHQQRPQMVSAWAGGADTGPTGQRLGDQQRWQAQLWRQVRGELGVPSPPERIGAVCDSLDTAEGAGELDLPERISAFGLTRLPDAQVQILTALARHRDVHLFLLHPSPKLWQQLAESMGEAVWPKSRVRAQASTGQLSANPLLASWGRDSRELQLVLASHTQSQAVLDRHYPVPDLSADRGGGSRTLLQRLQDDIRHNRVPVGAPFAQIDSDARPLCDPASDTSVQVHACHGNARQVQVLRDAVLHLLASDPTLEPRDIVIMCPDVDSFAPQISATFGAVPELRVRLADRSAAQTNPLISTVALLLSLLDSRFTATDVVGLLSTVPVRQRFGFSDDDLERIAHWVDEAGIRWGLDQRQRARWQLADTGANTWSAGLDRILLGVAMADEELRVVGGAVPLDDVRSADIELAGRLAEFVERLGQCAAFFAGEFTLTEGVSRLLEAVDQLTATTVADALQRQQLQRMVDEVAPDGVDRVGTTASAALLNFVEFRDIVRATWSGRPTRANFRTGHITVCTLTPMRSVPHRVVCLLGLDDGAFPRANRVFGDDLTAEPPFIGDQDRRSEDRQLLLDALLAATESVVITYSGRDERSNAVKQPSVPLAELLSVIDATVRVERPDHDIVVHHPLQSFDPRNFERGRLVKGRVWSYDEDAFAASTALLASRTPRGPFLPELLPALPNRTVDVGALVQFVQHPTRSFVKTRLGLDLAKASEARTDEFEVQMSGLLSWQAAEPLIETLSAISDDDSIPEAGLAWHRW